MKPHQTRKFVDYISRKKEQYEEGKDLKSKILTNAASKKFKMLKDQNKWNAPSPKEEKIFTLQA